MTRTQLTFAAGLAFSILAWALGTWGFYLWSGPGSGDWAPRLGDAVDAEEGPGRGLATLLGQRRGEFRRLHGFPILDRGCTEDVLRGRNEELARAVHQDYRRKLQDRGRGTRGDPSLAPWSSLPESLKRSNRRQADHIFTKLDAVGCGLMPDDPRDPEHFTFEPGEVERLARLEHERWAVASGTGQGRRAQDLALPGALGRTGRRDPGTRPGRRAPPARTGGHGRPHDRSPGVDPGARRRPARTRTRSSPC